MKSKHAPLPWYFKDGMIASERDDAGGGTIATCRERADGEYIVRAANSHADLLAACKMALKRLLQLDAEDGVETIGPCPACEAIRKAIAAAAAAEGGGA